MEKLLVFNMVLKQTWFLYSWVYVAPYVLVGLYLCPWFDSDMGTDVSSYKFLMYL